MTWGRLLDDGEVNRAICEDEDAIGWMIHDPDAAGGNKAFFKNVQQTGRLGL